MVYGPLDLGNLLGLTPGTECDFGVCNPIGNGYTAGEIAIQASKLGNVVLTAADWLGIALGVLVLQKGDLNPPTDDRCVRVRAECEEQCFNDDTKVPKYKGADTFSALRKCVRACMKAQGCYNY